MLTVRFLSPEADFYGSVAMEEQVLSFKGKGWEGVSYCLRYCVRGKLGGQTERVDTRRDELDRGLIEV